MFSSGAVYRSDLLQLSSNGTVPQMRLNSDWPKLIAERFPKYQSVVSSLPLSPVLNTLLALDSICIRFDFFLFFLPAFASSNAFFAWSEESIFVQRAAESKFASTNR